MKKQFTILLILFFVSVLFLIASPSFAISSASDCDEPNAKITSISPTAAVPIGGSLVINGYGFGELKKVGNINDRYIDISLMKNGIIYSAGAFEKDNGIVSWTDTKIEVTIPGGIESEFLRNVGPNDYIDLTKDSLVLSIYHSNFVNNVAVGAGTHYICADPFLSASFLYSPSCNADIWICSDWNTCSIEGQQSRICNKTLDCRFADTPSPVTTQSCVYIPPSCNENSWSCSNWGVCSAIGQQTRTCNKISNCEGGVTSPATTQSCTYTPACTSSDWSCGSWSSCSSNSTQTRSCSKNSKCEGGTQSPTTTQSCTYIACSQDTWECGNWGTCSPQGIQTRNCNRTYDCPSAETAAPATSQYCEAPNQPKLQSPTEDLGIVNQDSIIKSTVKLICPVSSTMASQGSGTVIDSKGTILTNKHVIDGTPGCLVGFIDNYDDEPYFGGRQIADIYKVSSDADVAVLKLRNPSNKTLVSVNISQANSSNIKLGEILTTYGYPAKFGTKITYTSGDFSGVDGNYLKTTAVIEHGNSGGGAYLKNGAFIGIPTAVIKGSLNSMGYLLSVNKVNSWLNNSLAYENNSNNNNYSRVSALIDDMDLNALGSLGLFVAGDEKNVKTGKESQGVIAEEKKLITKVDNNLSKKMSGNILLQVEKNGEGWYVNPDNKKKYYLGRPADAFSIMRNLGLGIKHNELAKYLNSKFSSKLSGKILLDVEQNGEAYYVNPKNLKGYFLNRPADAFKVMRDLGLGITNADIRKIGVGEVK